MPRKCVFKDQQLFEAIHTQQSQFSGLSTVSSETITLQQKKHNNNNKKKKKKKKYILSNLGVCPMQLFIFYHVTFIQFKICCWVQNFIKIGWFFAEVWRYNDFQNGVRHLGIVLPPYETAHEVSVAGRSCLSNFMSILYEWRYSYLNFSHIWLEMPIQAPKWGFWGDFGPLNVIIHHLDPQKAHPCANPRLLSYQL